VTEPVVPALQSAALGSAQYFRPAPYVDASVGAGADDGGEMGAFHDAQIGARREGLGARLAEYIPVGLAAGFFDVPAPSRRSPQS
jgi:hypothetical protein